MRSLSVRIFLSLVVVNVAVALAVSLVYGSAFERGRQQRVALVADSMLLRGADAARALRRGDPASAEELLVELEQRVNVRVVIVDRGEIVASAPGAPAGLRALAARAAEARELVRGSPPDGEGTWIAAPVRSRWLDGVVIAGALIERPDRWGPIRIAPHTLQLLLLLLLSGLLSIVLARLLSGPIRTLRGATRRLAAGDVKVRVGPAIGRAADDEVTQLARDFDRMAARIEALLEARETLLRDVSHELRSPLARLSVALEIARREAGSSAQPALDRIEREAERLDELVGLVLTMARLEHAGGIERAEDVHVDELVQQLASDAHFEAESAGRALVVRSSAPCVVRGGSEILRQAIENVMRNAVRFTAEGTTVTVDLSVESEDGARWARLEVRDHGPGVPDDALEEIFRPFTRVESARERASGGAGVGLAITERAVRLHGGEVRASNAEGGGLVVTIRLPIRRSGDKP